MWYNSHMAIEVPPHYQTTPTNDNPPPIVWCNPGEEFKVDENEQSMVIHVCDGTQLNVSKTLKSGFNGSGVNNSILYQDSFGNPLAYCDLPLSLSDLCAKGTVVTLEVKDGKVKVGDKWIPIDEFKRDAIIYSDKEHQYIGIGNIPNSDVQYDLPEPLPVENIPIMNVAVNADMGEIQGTVSIGAQVPINNDTIPTKNNGSPESKPGPSPIEMALWGSGGLALLIGGAYGLYKIKEFIDDGQRKIKLIENKQHHRLSNEEYVAQHGATLEVMKQARIWKLDPENMENLISKMEGRSGLTQPQLMEAINQVFEENLPTNSNISKIIIREMKNMAIQAENAIEALGRRGGRKGGGLLKTLLIERALEEQDQMKSGNGTEDAPIKSGCYSPESIEIRQAMESSGGPNWGESESDQIRREMGGK